MSHKGKLIFTCYERFYYAVIYRIVFYCGYMGNQFRMIFLFRVEIYFYFFPVEISNWFMVYLHTINWELKNYVTNTIRHIS